MTAIKLLNREQILTAKDVVFKDVACPEFAPEGTPEAEREQYGVRIRNLTGTGRGVFLQRSIAMKQAAAAVVGDGALPVEKIDFDIEMLLMAMTAVDENFAPIFTEADVKALGEKNGAAVSRCAAAAQALAGLTEKAKEEAAKK